MNDSKSEQEIFDVLNFYSGQNRNQQGIEVDGYMGSVRLVKGFFTTNQLEKIKEIFPRMNFDNGLIIGDWY